MHSQAKVVIAKWTRLRKKEHHHFDSRVLREQSALSIQPAIPKFSRRGQMCATTNF